MDANARPRVLCVDDEPNLLEGLKLHLRRGFEADTAVGAEAALALLESSPPYAVVVSDMRMPGMDGATFLSRVRERWPETVRMLLTGQTDLDSAIAAVNQGQIFRFLTKPCPPDTLIAAVSAGVEQHRLITAERVLLEQTLRGSIRALTEVLTLAHPSAFGRANRVNRHVQELASHLGLSDRWETEVATMLSELGCITLPTETVEKIHRGEILTEHEHELVERLPAVTERLLGNIPRLEGVRQILRYQQRRFNGAGAAKNEPRGEEIPIGARLIKLAQDYDVLETTGVSQEVAFDTLRGRAGWYDPALLEAFARLKGNAGQSIEVIEVKLTALRPGMVFVEDVKTHGGSLLVARGNEATESLLERLRNFSMGHGVREPIRVTASRRTQAVETGDLVARSS